MPSYTKPTVKCWLFFTYFLSFVQTKSIILLLMVVYIEYVILDNLTFDFLILFCTNKITKSNAKIWQLILGALLGTATAIALPYVGGGVLLYLYKTASLVVMNLPLGCKKLAQKCLTSLAVTFCLGGTLVALFWFFGVPFSLDTTLTYQSQIPFGVWLLSIFFAVFLVWIVFHSAKRAKKLANFSTSATAVVDGKRWNVVALLDSGNTLSHQGLPVCFACGSLSQKLQKPLSKAILLKQATSVDYQTVDSKEKAMCIKGFVEMGKVQKEVYFAISNQTGGEFQLILNQSFLEEEND